ncbi:MAG: radical SAM family heme chaperone HemW [Calditrichaceae bacterium]|nr:radical SAM family heme chaperone HemW [Calditrichaceae bacterium]MBN2707746.1 radical SAM family heme chaperone HemW [Calditrichaceae bacterium]RQV96381.1 MAG: radical SAM family heme chaperone HemW [Calditrichota bacterium]
MLINSSGLPGIYIHVPFCIRRCGYCDFYSQTDLRLRNKYISALLKEIDIYASELNNPVIFDTIYLGGGTPSLLSINHITQILNKIYSRFRISNDAEITLEMNPGSLEAKKMADFYQAGINRLSIGVQSFHIDELAFLERIHSVNDALLTIETARKAGFDNISIDLIFGLPSQTPQKWNSNLEKAVEFSPEHISTYNLTIEKETNFYQRMQNGELMIQNDENLAGLFIQTLNVLQKNGYRPYEISNFAKSELYHSRHNIKYWQHVPYLGFGPSAHSYWDEKRWWNFDDIALYINMLNKEIKPVKGEEEIDRQTKEFESIMLELRTYQGISLDKFYSRFNHRFTETYSNKVNMLIEKGLAEIKDGFFRLNYQGMLISDEIFSDFNN